MNFNLKYSILNNWTAFRWLKLVLSVIFIIQAGIHSDLILGIGGIFLLLHTILNLCTTCNNEACKLQKNK